jgi:hypothetical protein
VHAITNTNDTAAVPCGKHPFFKVRHTNDASPLPEMAELNSIPDMVLRKLLSGFLHVRRRPSRCRAIRVLPVELSEEEPKHAAVFAGEREERSSVVKTRYLLSRKEVWH